MPDFVIPVGGFHFALHDCVRFTQDRQSLRRDLAQNANGKTRPGEWLAIHNLFRQTQLEARLAHFVFEQLAHRFNQLEVHLFWQPTDVMMGFNDLRGVSLDGHALYHIWIQRSLCEKAELVNGNQRSVVSFCKIDDRVFEHANELVADDFAFLLRISNAAQLRHEPF